MEKCWFEEAEGQKLVGQSSTLPEAKQRAERRVPLPIVQLIL